MLGNVSAISKQRRFRALTNIGLLAAAITVTPAMAYAFCPDCAPVPAIGAGAISWAALTFAGVSRRWLRHRRQYKPAPINL